MSTQSLLRAAVLPLLAVMTLPLTAAAQQADSRLARADALYEQATRMEQAEAVPNHSRHIRRTARLYLQSAALREISDPLRVESLYRAGVLLYPIDPRRSHQVLGQAAELALIHGDVSRTAHLFVDAAWVVHAERFRSPEARLAANQYLLTARTLADSPVLTAAERDAILRRIKPTTVAMHSR